MMTDDIMERASAARNRISQIKQLLDRDKILETPKSMTTSSELWGNNVQLLNESTIEKIETLAREDLAEQLRLAQEEFDRL